MNNGLDTAYYLHLGYNVIAVEANPTLVAEACNWFRKEIREERLLILNIGIADKECRIPFYVNEKESQWSSFKKEMGSRIETPFHEVMINCFPLTYLMKVYGTPHYCKIDIEGHDELCLDDLLGSFPEYRPEYLSVEADNLGMLDKLQKIGYSQFKLVNQGHMEQRVHNNWHFDTGSSGMFGEDIPGPWCNAETIIEQFNNPQPYCWYDFHAKL